MSCEKVILQPNRLSETPPLPLELSARWKWIPPVAVVFTDTAVLSMDAKLTARLLGTRRIASCCVAKTPAALSLPARRVAQPLDDGVTW
jgi:hypothetical protein